VSFIISYKVTHARAKVASYAFTTLDPHLGVLHGGYILADIPGLIEGASEGKGLGHKFLRHVKRTKMLLHLISLENEDVEAAYRVVRKELEKYGEGLTDKKEVIILTKTDLADDATIKKAMKTLKDGGLTSIGPTSVDIFEVTILDDDSVKKLADKLAKLLVSH
jgi:GTP-binding protein